MAKDNDNIVYISDGFVRQCAGKKGLELSVLEPAEMVGDLYGVIRIGLDRLIRKKILRRDIEEAAIEQERMELLLDYLDEEDVL